MPLKNGEYNALDAHLDSSFTAGMPRQEIEYYSKIHSLPSKSPPMLYNKESSSSSGESDGEGGAK